MLEHAQTTAPTGRRERKKAATRRAIADAALRLFREHGYSAVGIRDVAAEADVAVTTLFKHFPSKEALVFEQAADFEDRLADAVAARKGEPLIPALLREVDALVRHCTTAEASRVWQMIDDTPELRNYAHVLELQYAQTLSAAIDAAPDLAVSKDASQTIARFIVDTFALARASSEPRTTLDQAFRMVEAAWAAANAPHGG